jgi:predicted membrane protein
MESESMLIWGMVFGSIGLGFFIYGKKQKKIVPLIVGLALFVFPYFIADISMLMTVGAILIVLPYFVRI